jgi:V/A-type H+-transporting ATPase subunit K
MTLNYDTPSVAIAGAVVLFAFSAAGALVGTSIAASAAAGAWKKCYVRNRPAPFALLIYVGMCMTNVFYGMLIMNPIIARATTRALIPGGGASLFGLCLVIGIVMGLAAWLQARAAAAAADAHGETGQGFTNYVAAIGIIEFVTIILLVFTLLVIDNFFAAAA